GGCPARACGDGGKPAGPPLVDAGPWADVGPPRHAAPPAAGPGAGPGPAVCGWPAGAVPVVGAGPPAGAQDVPAERGGAVARAAGEPGRALLVVRSGSRPRRTSRVTPSARQAVSTRPSPSGSPVNRSTVRSPATSPPMVRPLRARARTV